MQLEPKQTDHALALATRTASDIMSGRQQIRSLEQRSIARQQIKYIAQDTLYGHPQLPDAQLEPVAAFYGIPVAEVGFIHVALYKQAIEAAKGDMSALNLLAAFSGEKPK